MRKPRVLDSFCGVGAASVAGVKPMKRVLTAGKIVSVDGHRELRQRWMVNGEVVTTRELLFDWDGPDALRWAMARSAGRVWKRVHDW